MEHESIELETAERTLILGLSDYKLNTDEFTKEVYENCRKIRGGVDFKIATSCFKEDVAAIHRQAVFKDDGRKIVFVVWLRLKVVAGKVVESDVQDMLFVNVTQRWYKNMRLSNVAEFEKTLEDYIPEKWRAGSAHKFTDLSSLQSSQAPNPGFFSKLKFWKKKKTHCQRNQQV